MNLDKLVLLAVSAVLVLLATHRIDEIQSWVWRAQAKLIYESRTETWGSPRFFPTKKTPANKSMPISNCGISQQAE